jgi:DNA-binding transcriptional regulator LsrR (DeoR family)
MNKCEDHTVVRDNSPRSRELLVKAARMYYLDGRSQDDIARVLETSRSNVSRMLGTARTLGIVEIRIQDELGRDADLEQALARQFDLTHVRVAAFRPQQDPLAATSALAAEWLDNTLRDGQVLALSWGTAVQATVAAVAVDEARRVEVVPLVGGLTTATPLAANQELVRDLAARLRTATYRYLYSPALLHSEAARDALLAEPSIGHTVARARSADIALVGIGTFGSSSSSEIVGGLGLTARQRNAFLAQEPIGDTCCRFFDAAGRAIRGVVHDRVLAVDLEDLRRIPTVMGVATGSEKTAGVLAALRGGVVDGLIVDAGLAHSILTVDGVL